MRGLAFLALFIGVPLIEIALFVQIGGRIGITWTIVIVIATAMAGTALLRMQGLAVMRQAQDTMEAGGVPVESLIDGLFLLIAGILLLTPGFLTDFVGFLFFIPPVRRSLGRYLWARVAKSGNVGFSSSRGGGRGPTTASPPGGVVIEGEIVEEIFSPGEAGDPEDGTSSGDTPKTGDSKPDSPWRQ